MSDREVPRGEDFNLAGLGMGILAAAQTVAAGKIFRASIELELDGSGGRCLVDPRDSALKAMRTYVRLSRRQGHLSRE